MLGRFPRYIGAMALRRLLRPRVDPDREGCTPGRSSAGPDMKHGEILNLLTYDRRANRRGLRRGELESLSRKR